MTSSNGDNALSIKDRANLSLCVICSSFLILRLNVSSELINLTRNNRDNRLKDDNFITVTFLVVNDNKSKKIEAINNSKNRVIDVLFRYVILTHISMSHKINDRLGDVNFTAHSYCISRNKRYILKFSILQFIFHSI